MAYRWHPKNSETDGDNPRAWASADCCGFIWPLHQLTFQYAYQGSTTPQSTGFLVCPKHIDPLNPQDTPFLLPPDPLPVYNARPEPYMLDEGSWLSTQDGDVILTQDGEKFITPIPNPDTAAVPNVNSIVQEASVDVVTEDGTVIVTEEGDGNPLNIDPNPGNAFPP